MKLTSRGRYAVTAVLDIAIYGAKHPVRLMEISERQHISLSYLEQLFAGLRKHEVVKSVRGPGGGYKLARPLSEITVAMVITAVNESIDVTGCGGQGGCRQGKECLTHALWLNLSQRIEAFLSNITLAELVAQKQDLPPLPELE